MKVALLSDIHSNVVAFRLMLEKLKEYNIDKYIFLGDIITDGTTDHECLELVKKYGSEYILGNREELILNMYDKRLICSDYINLRPLFGTLKMISKEDIDFLKTWEKQKIIEINGYKILLIHGKNPYIGDLSYKDNLDYIIDNYEFDICFYGHTHIAEYFLYQDKLFCNPASLGEATREATYKCMVIDINEDINVNLVTIDTKKSFGELKKNYLNTEYYNDNKIWCNLYLLGNYNGYDYIYDFMDYINSHIYDGITKEEYERVWNESYQRIIDSIEIKKECRDLI